MFSRLTGQEDDLVAYYTFDAVPANSLVLKDQSLAGNHLTLSSGSTFVLSTAPVGKDAPKYVAHYQV